MKLTRRDILRLGLGASALAFAPIRLHAEGVCPKSIPIALQHYSVREIAMLDQPKSYETIAAMGYKAVEFAGTGGLEAKFLRKLLDDAGLKCCGTHLGMGNFEGDELKRTVEYYKTLGTKYLTISWMGVERTVDDWKKRADWFNEKSALCQEDGMFIGYHNHSHEFGEHVFDGVPAWEILFGNTDAAVLQQLDIGNCISGGGDPVKYIRMFPGRTHQVHMKEHGGEGIIGKGSVDWKEVISAAAEVGGTEWFIVETEHRANTYEDAEACFKNLVELL